MIATSGCHILRKASETRLAGDQKANGEDGLTWTREEDLGGEG